MFNPVIPADCSKCPGGTGTYKNYLDSNGKCPDHCPEGQKMWQELKSHHNYGYSHDRVLALYEKTLRTYYQHQVECHGAEPRPTTTHDGNGKHSGAWAFTLTKSPDDDLSEEDMIKAVTKVMNQRSIPTTKFAWYLEYGDEEKQTHPHIHGMYETENGGMIEMKHWKRAWKIWNPKQKLGLGFRGGYHRPVRAEECYDDYIKKQGLKGERFGC